MIIETGDSVLLLSSDEKTFLVTVTEGKGMGTHMGELNLGDAIGKNYGDAIYTNLENRFLLLEPTIEDLMMKVRRLTQIIYPKDAGLILLKTGIRPGMRVIECGAGSGALTIALANAVSPGGKVYTYDRNERFLDNARQNIINAGFGESVEFKHREAQEGFAEEDVDAVVLDLPSPWDGIPAAAEALRGGGRIASLSPTYNQVEECGERLTGHGFVFLETVEVLVRHIRVSRGKTRPHDRMVSHTGFLTFGRKANPGAPPSEEPAKSAAD